MKIKAITNADIPQWKALSSEYDRYVRALVSDLSEWYGGNEVSPAFDSYMMSKINKGEAFMATDFNYECLGIVAISKNNNRITFFGVSHKADFQAVGEALLCHAFHSLDNTKPICINEIASLSAWMQQHRELYLSLGFAFSCNSFENSVPVNTYEKLPLFL